MSARTRVGHHANDQQLAALIIADRIKERAIDRQLDWSHRLIGLPTGDTGRSDRSAVLIHHSRVAVGDL
jgi:hypothetical protein